MKNIQKYLDEFAPYDAHRILHAFESCINQPQWFVESYCIRATKLFSEGYIDCNSGSTQLTQKGEEALTEIKECLELKEDAEKYKKALRVLDDGFFGHDVFGINRIAFLDLLKSLEERDIFSRNYFIYNINEHYSFTHLTEKGRKLLEVYRREIKPKEDEPKEVCPYGGILGQSCTGSEQYTKLADVDEGTACFRCILDIKERVENEEQEKINLEAKEKSEKAEFKGLKVDEYIIDIVRRVNVVKVSHHRILQAPMINIYTSIFKGFIEVPQFDCGELDLPKAKLTPKGRALLEIVGDE